MQHNDKALHIVVRGKVRKHIDSDMDTLALVEKTFDGTSAIPAHHYSTPFYYALVHGMCVDLILTFPASTGNRLFERSLWAAVGSTNCQQYRP
jgi:hypothetical protein